MSVARLKIELPESFIFSTDIPVQVNHLNYGNHLGHDALISILHEARVRFLACAGFSELDVDGAGIMVADLAVNYLHEGFYGDELRIDIAVSEFSRASADLDYRVTNRRSGVRIAAARTRITFFDLVSRRPTRVPSGFKIYVAEISGESKH